MSMTANPTTNNQKTDPLPGQALAVGAKTILIVDDEADFVELTKLHLEGAGYLVESAFDGVQGIKKIMASNYAVILCDMMMPNLAGDKFYLAVERVKPELCKRFIFVTGHRGDPKMDAFIRKVRGLILWKPFQIHVLLETIQAIEKKAG
ncbi:MAG: response regulator [Verrucomicrobia bacterium]|nr:response regulator [Verrucomicrobiota bacterium]